MTSEAALEQRIGDARTEIGVSSDAPAPIFPVVLRKRKEAIAEIRLGRGAKTNDDAPTRHADSLVRSAVRGMDQYPAIIDREIIE